MAQLPNTELEDHPTGTGGLNSVLNGNWERLDELFDPALGGADAGFAAFGKALLRDAMTSMVNGETIVFTPSGFKRRAPVATLTFAATTDIDFLSGQAAPVQLLSLTGDVTITTSNLTAGQEIRVVIAADASTRNLTWPTWLAWVGAAAPASIAANKTAVLKLISTTTADAGVVAEWVVEP